MVAKNLIEDVLALPAADRLELYERLGDSLFDEPEVDPISPEHAKLLDERLLKLETNPADVIPWADVKADLEASLRSRK